jgi:spermidine synthase
LKETRQEGYTRESNYYTIQVFSRSLGDDSVKMLYLDRLRHSYTDSNDPTVLIYDYLKIFKEIVTYFARDNPSPRILHLGGGGYTFPRYMEYVYHQSVNEVVEIDPAVTEVAHLKLGLPLATSIKTYNQDARLFLIQRNTRERYDFVIGDVFNDRSTPYHLTTLEFDRLVKANLKDDGIYMVNIVDDYEHGRYLPSFLYTLSQTFDNVYLLDTGNIAEKRGISTFVIVATERSIDISDYTKFATQSGATPMTGTLYNETQLATYMSDKKSILLTDDYAPTDILVAPLIDKE